MSTHSLKHLTHSIPFSDFNSLQRMHIVQPTKAINCGLKVANEGRELNPIMHSLIITIKVKSVEFK